MGLTSLWCCGPRYESSSATTVSHAWDRIDETYRSYLRGAGISAEGYNGAPLRGKTDLRNNFLEDQRRTTMWKLSPTTTEEHRRANIIEIRDIASAQKTYWLSVVGSAVLVRTAIAQILGR